MKWQYLYAPTFMELMSDLSAREADFRRLLRVYRRYGDLECEQLQVSGADKRKLFYPGLYGYKFHYRSRFCLYVRMRSLGVPGKFAEHFVDSRDVSKCHWEDDSGTPYRADYYLKHKKEMEVVCAS